MISINKKTCLFLLIAPTQRDNIMVLSFQNQRLLPTRTVVLPIIDGSNKISLPPTNNNHQKRYRQQKHIITSVSSNQMEQYKDDESSGTSKTPTEEVSIGTWPQFDELDKQIARLALPTIGKLKFKTHVMLVVLKHSYFILYSYSNLFM